MAHNEGSTDSELCSDLLFLYQALLFGEWGGNCGGVKEIKEHSPDVWFYKKKPKLALNELPHNI